VSWLGEHRLVSTIALVCVVLALLVGAQYVAQQSLPTGGYTATGLALGQTGWAYLGGLRTFAAAVLWNPLDEQFHRYYGGALDSNFKVFMPTIRLVQVLDPHFEQSYYVAAYELAQAGYMPEALKVAREGVDNNPLSGRLRSNYIQILLIQDKKKNLPLAVEQAKAGIQPDMTFTSGDNKFEAYGVFKSVFNMAGEKDLARQVAAEQAKIQTEGGIYADVFGGSK
jgi:hypothetical protein